MNRTARSDPPSCFLWILQPENLMKLVPFVFIPLWVVWIMEFLTDKTVKNKGTKISTKADMFVNHQQTTHQNVSFSQNVERFAYLRKVVKLLNRIDAQIEISSKNSSLESSLKSQSNELKKRYTAVY